MYVPEGRQMRDFLQSGALGNICHVLFLFGQPHPGLILPSVICVRSAKSESFADYLGPWLDTLHFSGLEFLC